MVSFGTGIRSSDPSRTRFPLVWSSGLGGFLLAVWLGVFATAVAAQETGRIIGQVTSAESGAPIGEVQVYLLGTGIGTLSNQSGRFVILSAPAGVHTIRAERIGLAAASQQVTVTAGGSVDVSFAMATHALGLDEIVVTGTAGAARRREIGNTIAQINVDAVVDRPVQVTDLLRGAATGIEVTLSNGEIGQGSRIQLRGQNSLAMRNQPIIYIDGVRMMSEGFPERGPPDRRGGRSANITASPIDQINPNDIERIEVIKGSAATTLYGTEASAGVIQIFTKRGSAGAPVWTVETQQGTAWSRKFGVDPGYFKDAAWPEGVDPVPYNFMEPFFRKGWLGLGDGDWGTVHNQQYFASVRGGGQNLQYFASGQYQDEVGIQPSDALERWTVRGNFSFTPVENLQFQWNSGYTNTWQKNTPSANNAQGLTLNVFRQERNYFGRPVDLEAANQLLVQDMQNAIERFTTGGTVTYSPLSNLTNRLTIGYDWSQQEQRHLRPFGFELYPQGALHLHQFEKRLLTFDYVGSYNFDLTDALGSTFSWGGQAIGDDERTIEAFAEDFPGAAAPTIRSGAINQGDETRQKVWNAGFFLQNVFDVQDRYFLTLGARVDGHSAFGQDFGLQMYPKASASWVVSDESFWQPAYGEVKLRVAYGKSGRAPDAFDAVRTWELQGWDGNAAFVPDNVGNPNLGPEVTTEFETGFDASWLEGRLQTDFTYYRQITDDALLNVPQVPSQGFTENQRMNLGKVKNSGIELSTSASVIQRADWGWDVGLDYSTTENEILDLGEVEPTRTLQEGFPLRPVVDDFITNPTETSGGKVGYCTDSTPAGVACLERDHFYGPSHPTRIIGGNTSVRLPYGISLSARGEYRGGHYLNEQVFAIGRSVRSPLCYPYYSDPLNSIKLKEGTPALWRARCTNPGEGYAFKADFFKLRSVTATVPVDFAFPDRINNAVLTLVLNNSFLWMREMPFMDPEMLGNDGVNSDSAGFSERVPSPITLRASLRITF